MIELNTLIVNKRSFNTARVSFDHGYKARKWIDTLTNIGIPYTYYVYIHGGKTYYDFKMFRIKKKIFTLYTEFKEVFE